MTKSQRHAASTPRQTINGCFKKNNTSGLEFEWELLLLRIVILRINRNSLNGGNPVCQYLLLVLLSLKNNKHQIKACDSLGNSNTIGPKDLR